MHFQLDTRPPKKADQRLIHFLGCLLRDDVARVGNRAQNDLRNQRDENPHSVVGHHVIQAAPNADGRQVDRGELPVIRRVSVVVMKELPHGERVFREL